MSDAPPENGPPRWQFSLGRLLLLPLAVALVFAPIAVFGTPGIPSAILLAWIVLGILFRFRPELTIVVAMLLVVVWAIWSGVHPVTTGYRPCCLNNLKQIGLALRGYHDTYGCFPPAYIADKNGKPMHSWRVLILPYLDNVGLYRRYRFDEPWDGPHNRKLHSDYMNAFRCPDDSATPRTMTSFVAVVGPGTAWPGSTTAKLSDFTDGPSQTIMVVETANSGIHWMEPKDLELAKMPMAINPESGKGISGEHERGASVEFVDGRLQFLRRIGGANVLFADGAARILAADLSTTLLRALLTIGGGERLEPTDYGWKLYDSGKPPTPPAP